MNSIGHLVSLKIPCLGNPVGTIGVCFDDYGDGRQYIFENGEYDGFSLERRVPNSKNETELDAFLNDLGFHDEEHFQYDFTNVIKLGQDFRKGVFDLAFQEGRLLRDNPPEKS